MRKRIFLSSAIAAAVLVFAWISIGVEKISGEFREDTEYVFFIKKHLGTKVLFTDPTNCNSGCDTPEFSLLNEKKLEQFSDYCFYRYDIFPAEKCYAHQYKNN